jgi:hypothetical protein
VASPRRRSQIATPPALAEARMNQPQATLPTSLPIFVPSTWIVAP